MAQPLSPALQPISIIELTFSRPTKRIQTHEDLPLFHSSPAYSLITSFIVHLNSSVSPFDASTGKLNSPEDFVTSSPSITVSPEVERITRLLNRLSDLVELAPPDTGPRRFGNAAFRKWIQLVESDIGESDKLEEYLPKIVIPAKEELLHYLTHSFGSAERLDYGTGHELSFAAFLCGIWVLGGFQSKRDEIALVFHAFDAYFKLVRKLVVTYSLEPAGSHGVWGLDDHVFLPYIFGSAQLTTFRPTTETQAAESNAKAEEANLPKPADVVKLDIVNRERTRNLYFDAIGFIYDVKKGPFWEHSPILYDISGVQKGWGKINEGMLKMYDKEVLGKLPVVQHFPFGTIFRWPPSQTPEQPGTPIKSGTSTFSPPAVEATRTSWTKSGPQAASSTMESTRVSWGRGGSQAIPSPMETTRAPWAAPQQQLVTQLDDPSTKAPWATKTPSPARSHQRSGANNADISMLMTESIPPWEITKEKKEEDNEADGVNVRTEAHLGPRRTNSPDSALALASRVVGGGNDDRKGSRGTGGVRVAETGDLSGRRASRTG